MAASVGHSARGLREPAVRRPWRRASRAARSSRWLLWPLGDGVPASAARRTRRSTTISPIMDAADFDAIIKAVREFIAKEVIPREDEIEETDAVPQVLRDAAAEMGLFGYALPEKYGGLGFTMVEEVRLCFEVGRTAPAFRSLFGTNNGIAGQTIANHGTEQQKDRYLRQLATGEAVACFALTEAE